MREPDFDADAMTDDEMRRAEGKLTAEEKLRLKVGAMGDREYERWAKEAWAREAAKRQAHEASQVPEPDEDPELSARIFRMSNREFSTLLKEEYGVEGDGFGLALPDDLADRSIEHANARRKAVADE